MSDYSDASFQTDRDNFYFHSDGEFLVSNGAVTWKSSKKKMVADSTCESKYIVASEVAKETTLLKNFVGDLRNEPSIQKTIEIFYENEG